MRSPTRIYDTNPELVARFEFDADKKPKYTFRRGRRHYPITYEIENAPTSAYVATFELDPTYYDSKRIVTADTEGKFRLKTTTYGDYDVMVRLRTESGEVPIASRLSRVLERSAAPAELPQIDDPLKYIASH